MRTYQRFRTPEEIKAACEKRGFRYDQEQFERGSDYITFVFRHGEYRVRVTYSTVNGRAFGEYSRGEDGARHWFSTDEEDNRAVWFEALLNFIYE